MEQAMSPTPKKVAEKVELNKMDFPSAIREVIAGKKITKLQWCNKAVYGLLENDRLTLYKDDGKPYHWILSGGDVEGTDWVVID